jgi:phage/plasmid-associated DNA primase
LNYVDEVFDPAWCTLPLDAAEMQVKGFSRILADQGYDRDMCSFFYAMLGRLFFKVKEMDDWDKLMVIKGVSGSGKSTVTRALTKLMGYTNIGVIPSRCTVTPQWQRALASVNGKALWMCVDLCADFRLAGSQLQSMVAGDMPVVHKGLRRDQCDVKWTAPGLLVGSHIPVAWSHDAQHAVSRHVVIFRFDNTPRPGPSVATDALNNVAKLLAVAVREYHALVRRHGRRDLDAALPRRMRESATALKKLSTRKPAL